MTDILETVKTLETRPKVERKNKHFKFSPEEIQMLAELAKAFETNESEVVRRLIKASYDTLHQ